MHDPRLTYIYMRKDLLLQCMHEAAAQHGTPSISPISLQSKRKRGFNFVEQLWSQAPDQTPVLLTISIN